MDLLRVLDLALLPPRKFFTPKLDGGPGWVGVKGGGRPERFINVIEFDCCDTNPLPSSSGYLACSIVENHLPVFNDIGASYRHLRNTLESGLEGVFYEDFSLGEISTGEASQILGLMKLMLLTAEAYFQSKLSDPGESDHDRAVKFAKDNRGWERAFGVHPEVSKSTTDQLAKLLDVKECHPNLLYTIYKIVVMVNLRPNLRLGKDAIGVVIPFAEDACVTATKRNLKEFKPCIPVFPAVCHCPPDKPIEVVHPAIVIRVESAKLDVAELESMIVQKSEHKDNRRRDFMEY